MPVANPEMVAVVPVPVTVPGLMVQLPVGRLFKIADPVATVQVGWVMGPTVGAVGVGLTVMISVVDVAHCPAVGVNV